MTENQNIGVLLAHVATAGRKPTEDEVAWWSVAAESFGVYQQREESYGKLWKASGAADNAMQIRSKAQRMMVGLSPIASLDSALDCVNYSIFHYINTKEGRA